MALRCVIGGSRIFRSRSDTAAVELSTCVSHGSRHGGKPMPSRLEGYMDVLRSALGELAGETPSGLCLLCVRWTGDLVGAT